MKKIKAIILALRIEFHWWLIRRYRKRFDALCEMGYGLNSKRIQKLNQKTSTHTAAVMRCQKHYDENYGESFGGVL